MGNKNKTLLIEEYLNKIRPYLKDVINHLKGKYHTWKIQLTIAINFMPSENNDEEHAVHSRNNNIKLMINDKGDKVIEEHFQLLLFTYLVGWETSIKGSGFIFDYVTLLQYKCHRINFKHNGLYVISPG